ncbi:MAG TPA: chemotaxis protein CheA [Sphingomicrobium sp.]|nr:chemotaxis protein CheA [Sphingomicrobium sp.]
MDELFAQFLIEGRELIAKATEDLIALDEDVAARGRVDSAFRAVHTLKGSVAIFDLAPMGVALHAAEDLLGNVRSSDVPIDEPAARALLGCLDQCDRWMDAVEASGKLPLEAPREAVRIATGLLALTGSPQAAAAASETDEQWVKELLDRQSARLVEARETAAPLVAVRYSPPTDGFFTGDDPMNLIGAVPQLVALEVGAARPWPPIDEFDPYQCNLRIELISAASEAEVRQIFRFIPDQIEIISVAPAGADGDSEPIAGLDAHRTIRVESSEIDRLLDLVGELVVTKNGLAHIAASAEAGADAKAIVAAIRATQAMTDRVVADMHRAVMDVRMVPLERVFRRLHRLVRELAQRLDRDLAFEIIGEGTRVDKAVADALFEPLLHLVRNAVDHGIEPPEARVAAGKSARGCLELSARTLGEQILIEIHDDGAGIDPARVKKVAGKRHIASAEQLDAMDDRATLQLIFAPGFSTVTTITDVSGRGVGMDAVKTAIERLGGRVSLSSAVGAGTNVSLRLPATAALTTILIVKVADERFGIPLDMVVETVRIARSGILPVGLGRAFVLRDKTLPLIELSALLGLTTRKPPQNIRILVVDSGRGQIGIAVDDFSERLDVMLRPMSGLLARIPGVSGTTLLGDGGVLLILNLAEIIG